ncbi:hypothetical protein [Kitasatospora sp. LaBMicrA B282]|uniref:hypothetical protein n=1 Tax=Kitasatospora sp. LaBMicrA B282 TaxID=3420949 RepID=UPI003D0E40C9
MLTLLPARPPTSDLVVSVEGRTVVYVPNRERARRRALVLRQLQATRRRRGRR